MNFSVIIDTCISLITIVIVLSIMTSAILEFIESHLRKRSKMLYMAIEKALNDPTLTTNYVERLYNHPKIKTMHRTPKGKPSYIEPQIFAEALIDSVIMEYDIKNPPMNRDMPLDRTVKFELASQELGNTDLGLLLQSFQISGNEIIAIKENIISWYKGYMDRVEGWFKKYAQMVLFLIGLVIAIPLNVDMVKLTNEVYTNQELRENLVATGLNLQLPEKTNTTESDTLIKTLSKNYKILTDTKLPIGISSWIAEEPQNFDIPDWAWKVLGLLITALFLSRGAQFWFNMLNRLINLRSAGKPETKIKKT